MTFAHVENRPQTLSDRIRETLIERIATGHYKAGERLIEMKLAAEFGTSQLPVREALRDLEMTGLVTSRPRRGSFVKPFDARRQKEIYLVRGALEEAAARVATPVPCRATSRPSSATSTACARRRAPATLEAIDRHSVAFHRAIVAAAGNELLLKLWDSLHLEIHTRITISEPGIDFWPSLKATSRSSMRSPPAMSSWPAACRASIRPISSTASTSDAQA